VYNRVYQEQIHREFVVRSTLTILQLNEFYFERFYGTHWFKEYYSLFSHLGLKSKNLFMIPTIIYLADTELNIEFVWNSMVFHPTPNLNIYWVSCHFYEFVKMKWYYRVILNEPSFEMMDVKRGLV
jgi:hypothetical protein